VWAAFTGDRGRGTGQHRGEGGEHVHRQDGKESGAPNSPTKAGPGLRLAACRAQRSNPVYRARYTCLTTREHNRLTPIQAQHSLISTHIMGSPARRLTNPITRRRAPTPLSYAGTDDGRGTHRHLTQNDSR
jgi:hypothetical protein